MKKWTVSETNRRLFIYVVLLFLLTLFLRVVLVGTYKADFGGSDQNVIYGIQRLMLGEALYQDPSLPSYAIIQYTPLFYNIAAAVAKLSGVDGHAVQSVYEVARSLNILFNLLTILVLAGVLRTRAISRERMWTYALPVIMVLTTHYYTRIDSLQLLCFTAAMAAYIRYLKFGGALRVILAALLCGACVMAKQNGVLAIGIIGFSLFFQQRKYVLALLFGIISIGAAAGIAWLCSNGNWMAFYQNAYLGLKNGVDLTWLYTIFISQFYFDLILCYFVSFIIARHAFKATTDKVYRFIGTGAVLSFLFALITGLKIGSSNNYFTEMLVFVLMGLPVLLESDYSSQVLFRIKSRVITIRLFAGIAFFALITSKTMGLFTSIYIEKRLISNTAEYNNEAQLLGYFKDSLQLEKGRQVYFTNRIYLDNFFIGYSVMPAKDVIYQTYTANPNTFNYKPFIEGMNSGTVKYVVMNDEDTSMNMRTKEEMPFVHFDEAKFERLPPFKNYTIFRYKN